MARGIYIRKRPRPLRTLGSIILIGLVIGFSVWTLQNNKKDPVVDTQLQSIISDWKKDINSVGLDADALIMRVDKVQIVERIPYGLLNRASTNDIIGRADHSTRTIWILERKYERHQLKALVYHELGHYIFNLHHVGDGLMMSTDIKEESGYYKDNWDILLPIYLDKCKRAR